MCMAEQLRAKKNLKEFFPSFKNTLQGWRARSSFKPFEDRPARFLDDLGALA